MFLTDCAPRTAIYVTCAMNICRRSYQSLPMIVLSPLHSILETKISCYRPWYHVFDVHMCCLITFCWLPTFTYNVEWVCIYYKQPARVSGSCLLQIFVTVCTLRTGRELELQKLQFRRSPPEWGSPWDTSECGVNLRSWCALNKILYHSHVLLQLFVHSIGSVLSVKRVVCPDFCAFLTMSTFRRNMTLGRRIFILTSCRNIWVTVTRTALIPMSVPYIIKSPVGRCVCLSAILVRVMRHVSRKKIAVTM
jgi:hypothetical protein